MPLLPLVAPGKRHQTPRPLGSADALLLARFAQQQGSVTAIVCADPSDAQRLEAELPLFAPGLRVAVFPDWETLPWDRFSPHHDLISERLATLWRLLQAQGKSREQRDLDVVLLPATTALTRLAPPSFLAATTFHFKKGQQLDEAAFRAQLVLAGYQNVSQVVSPGEYAVRGSLIDLFPMGSLVPYRVDLFGDEIDSIRVFDPDSQRSLYPVPEVRLLPGREFPMSEGARTAFRGRWREHLDGDPSKARLYKDMGEGLAGAGIEYYLPLFFDETVPFFDYLGPGASVALLGEVDEALQRFWQDTRERHKLLVTYPERPILPPESIFLRTEQLFACTQPLATLAVRGPGSAGLPQASGSPSGGGLGAAETWGPTSAVDYARPLPDVSIERGAQEPLARLGRHLDTTPHKVLLLAESEGRRESLLDLLREHKLDAPSVKDLAEFDASGEKFALLAAPLAQGFIWIEGDRQLQLVTETELFATTPSTRRRRRQEQASNVEALIKDLSELKVGDPVVHLSHGIGRYQGLKHMDIGQGASEFLHLTYADEAVLYVPVAQLHLIQRYTGVSAEEAPLHRLGSGQWEKAKRKAAEQVRDTAAELLNLY
ncbi:MAG: CarD family transcriptional regulator, partial [Inhella sp.]